jgi:hypothetical protein
MRSTKPCQSASCSGEGGGGSTDMVIASLMQSAIDHRTWFLSSYAQLCMFVAA